ncbi:hypothetical protein [Mycolicibacterium frederiksbergense]|uniref:Alpha/beta hydrolase n=1 Tax=Mycolicibacterium frederiksbergense TaxID=117567 RepID=A0A6H0S3V7_9MYCO|nr:hypothetical protein [Mycolicibacterium frederiksbergense]QIV81129.1 hypothetical protein EXE63_09665 [Mycolicibacterium frederiksbergense]
MGISISRWIGAGVLAFGVVIAPTALLGPAAIAHADTDTGEPSSAEPRDAKSPDAAKPDVEGPSHNDDRPTPDEETAERTEAEPEAGRDVKKRPTLRTVDRVRDHEPGAGRLAAQAPEPAEPVEQAAVPERVTATSRPIEHRVARTSVAQVVAATSRVTVAEAPEAAAAAAQPAPTAAAATARPNLINIVGTAFFNLFDRVVKFFEGPPVVPPGRAVRLARTPLELDCGNGYTVDADWYFPTETEPDKIIYLQHGAFARAGLYNVTASDLAVRNNAIVVAPSITSNFFACDGCSMGGDQMHAAVADLFIGDRAALTASALAAGWDAPLPQRFVISGHSGGGQLAGGAAGYYAVRAPADEVYNLAGVLLLDTSALGGAVERGIARIPLDIPVHHIAASPALLNTYGDLNPVLAQLRAGFVGVQLIGGTHNDAWRTTNGLAQFVGGLGGGFSQARNVDAVQELAQAWISDWFNGTHTDAYYGERGETITIETPAGQAQAYVIPGPAPRLNFFDRILLTMMQSTVIFGQFTGNCAADPAVTPNSAGSLLVDGKSTADTALSLDGRRQTGQSVFQQCRRG